MKKTHTAWAVAGAAALLLAGTPAAYAESGQAPYIGWASSVSEDLGTLQIPISSDSDITGIKARVILDATQSEVAVVEGDALALFSGTAQDGIWRTREPLKLDVLGSYSVQVEATDADGDHARGSGSLAYFVAAQIEDVRTDRTKIDVDHRDVKVQGVLKGRWPGTREVKPLAGFPVDIDVRARAKATPTTDAKGRFSATVQLDEAAEVRPVYRHSPDHPEVLFGEGPATRVEVKQTPTRWTTIRTSAAGVDLGQPVTVTARLEHKTAKGWEPFAGQHGATLFTYGPDVQSEWLGEFTTAADGTVTVTASPYNSGRFVLTNRAEDEDPFTASVSGESKEVEVRHPAAFSRFGATRTEAGTVRVEGALEFASNTPGTSTVLVQFSRDGRRWSDVTTTEADWQHAFSVDVAKNGPGWFRARFVAPKGYQAATTPAVQVTG
ncbi:hypothetical protein [Streptomyces sp. NPDC059949]|uniref:hypothetical protein n=1 Tax=Streptomyces sp. NPDC059949 TaxID=3347013 RepID=UPI003650943A